MLWHIFDSHYLQASKLEMLNGVSHRSYDSRFTIHYSLFQAQTVDCSFASPQLAAPPEPDTDPLSPTPNGPAIEFVLVLNCWL